MAEQKLVKVDARLRKTIELTTSTNKRMANNWQAEQKRKEGKAACTWCGAEPCGHLWTRPGGASMGQPPGGGRCCEKCSHDAVEGWQHTHTAWDRGQYQPVCAIPMQEGDVVYMRRDGVVHFIEFGEAPEPGKPEHARSMAVACLGNDGGAALHAADDHAEEPVNFWQFARELAVDWLPARMAASVSRNVQRYQAIAAELAEIVASNAQKLAEHVAEDKARMLVNIERRQIEHEKRLLEDEIAAQGKPAELAELDAEMDETDSDLSDEDAAVVDATPGPAEPVKVNLKDPVPVKKGPGRPKRSWRQRRARERQRAAWVTAEARSRLEVKRLERLGRADGKKLVKDE